MSEDLTYEDLLKAIAPRADQLNADDLLPGPITVAILDVRKVSDAKQPYHLDVEGYPGRPWKPCITMLRVMAHVWSDEADEKVPPAEWIGRRVTLYCDPTVTYGGHAVGGIRISHMSDISKPYDLTVTITRGKRKAITIAPLAAASPVEMSADDAQYIATARKELAAVDTLDELAGCGQVLKGKSPAIQNALRPIYATRRKELQG